MRYNLTGWVPGERQLKSEGQSIRYNFSDSSVCRMSQSIQQILPEALPSTRATCRWLSMENPETWVLAQGSRCNPHSKVVSNFNFACLLPRFLVPSLPSFLLFLSWINPRSSMSNNLGGKKNTEPRAIFMEWICAIIHFLFPGKENS